MILNDSEYNLLSHLIFLCLIPLIYDIDIIIVTIVITQRVVKNQYNNIYLMVRSKWKYRYKYKLSLLNTIYHRSIKKEGWRWSTLDSIQEHMFFSKAKIQWRIFKLNLFFIIYLLIGLHAEYSSKQYHFLNKGQYWLPLWQESPICCYQLTFKITCP